MNKSCASQVVEVDSFEGLCCPPIGDQLWNAHPRVYLAAKKDAKVCKCYYCGTRYIKKEKGI